MTKATFPREALIEQAVAAASRMGRAKHPAWMAQDLTFGQLRLLYMLDDGGSLTVGQVAERLGVTVATASETIDRIEGRGLAGRRHRQEDRRQVECQLSDEGRRLIEQVSGARAEWMRGAVSVLTARELATFTRLLAKIADRLEAIEHGRET